jgi:hypothetical protein
MTSYSSNANVQNLVYGTTNSDWDAASTAARDVATSVINAKLDRTTDIASASDLVTRCCTLLAAGILSTSPSDKVGENTYWKQGMILLEQLRGDDVDDASWGKVVPIERFGSRSELYEDRYALW